MNARAVYSSTHASRDRLFEGLRDGLITEETLPDSLDRLPRALNEVYEEGLAEHARRSGIKAEQQAKILMCIRYTSRPLRLIELGAMLSCLLQIDLRQGKNLVRAGCGRLLEVLEDESVTVIHHSFTEFLRDTVRRDHASAFPVLDDRTCHGLLAALLLEYLDSCPPFDIGHDYRTSPDRDHQPYHENEGEEEEQRDNRTRHYLEVRASHPLAEYAAENLSVQLDKAAAAGPIENVLAALDRFLISRKPALQNWSILMSRDLFPTSDRKHLSHSRGFQGCPVTTCLCFGAYC